MTKKRPDHQSVRLERILEESEIFAFPGAIFWRFPVRTYQIFWKPGSGNYYFLFRDHHPERRPVNWPGNWSKLLSRQVSAEISSRPQKINFLASTRLARACTTLMSGAIVANKKMCKKMRAMCRSFEQWKFSCWVSLKNVNIYGPRPLLTICRRPSCASPAPLWSPGGGRRAAASATSVGGAKEGGGSGAGGTAGLCSPASGRPSSRLV